MMTAAESRNPEEGMVFPSEEEIRKALADPDLPTEETEYRDGIRYVRVGGYYFPDIRLDPEPELGFYGTKKLEWMKEHDGIHYTWYLMEGKLFRICKLAEIEAEEQEWILLKQYLESFPAPDMDSDPEGWAGFMGMAEQEVRRMVLEKVIYRAG